MRRKDFFKTMGVAGAAIATGSITACTGSSENENRKMPAIGKFTPDPLIIPREQGLRITGTLLDEISMNIPHQNWGEAEWDADFAYMKAIGIDTVIMIRCGFRKFIAYPSEYLLKKYNCYMPSMDLLDMFLRLADKHGMKFWFGLYDSGKYWETKDLTGEIENNKFVTEEVWKKYGHHKSFGGWYLSTEISQKIQGAVEGFREMGQHCKDLSGGLPTFISPWVEGVKAVWEQSSLLTNPNPISIEEHERQWDEILAGVSGVVDICAFQDRTVDYDELEIYLELHKKLLDKYGIESWTNAETFDRDMPIKFLPIKFDKLRMKLEAAKRANYTKAITFEFSHFMSPQSTYLQAGHLYNRYRDYFNIK